MSLDFEFTPEQKMVEEIVWRWASTWLEPRSGKESSLLPDAPINFQQASAGRL